MGARTNEKRRRKKESKKAMQVYFIQIPRSGEKDLHFIKKKKKKSVILKRV